MGEQDECNRLAEPLGERMLEVEPLRIGPWEELVEQPGVTGNWIVVQESVLPLSRELQIERRYRELGWVGTQGSQNCP